MTSDATHHDDLLKNMMADDQSSTRADYCCGADGSIARSDRDNGGRHSPCSAYFDAAAAEEQQKTVRLALMFSLYMTLRTWTSNSFLMLTTVLIEGAYLGAALSFQVVYIIVTFISFFIRFCMRIELINAALLTLLSLRRLGQQRATV